MDREELLREMTRTVEELRAFNSIGKTLTSTLDIREVLAIIMQKISELMKPHNWSLLLLDEKSSELYFEIAVGQGADKLKELRLAVGEGVAGWVAKEGKPVLVADAHQDERWCKKVDELTNYNTRSILCVPLVARGDVLGVIELVNAEANSFSAADLRLLESLADYAAIAIENARNFLRVQELTVTDDVTSLYNSRYLHEMLQGEFERSRRYDLTFSVIFFDLDFFKNVNDEHGHLCGSKLLKEVGDLVRANLRTVDIPTRYGGDEFVIILPQTTKMQALHVTRRLRLALNERVFLTSEDMQVRVTASFGVSNFPVDTGDKDSVLRMADEAMYHVKESTRDGIQIADPAITPKKANAK
ncbi:MAG: sensor domain-containing diguanylate cyclase [Deltaproteobacteria bacterium]|nr:sensor domain-containing diguanylate cyclase [Deltaproteobacteria bacterium]MBW1872007.1 sensor domain-containing diguanylate cyclase [Deltaproteobacteria bacterium]